MNPVGKELSGGGSVPACTGLAALIHGFHLGEEVADVLLVFFGVLGEGVGVDGAGGDPHFLVAECLGVIVPLQVGELDEVVGIAVDKEHRQYAQADLAEG